MLSYSLTAYVKDMYRRSAVAFFLLQS